MTSLRDKLYELWTAHNHSGLKLSPYTSLLLKLYGFMGILGVILQCIN